jgi:hypothetical protein
MRPALVLYCTLEYGTTVYICNWPSGQGARCMQSYGKATRQTPRKHHPAVRMALACINDVAQWTDGSILVRVTDHKQYYPDDAPD